MSIPPLELTTTRYDDRGVPWTPLDRPSPVALDDRTKRYLALYTGDAIMSGLTGPQGVLQELTPGLELRVWIAGTGETVVTETPDHTEPFGVGIDARVQHLPHFVESIAAPGLRIRTGTRLGWDQPLPFPIDDPPEEPTKSIGSGTDPAKWLRVRVAREWVQAWGDVLLRYAPFAPIIVEGVAVGPGLSPSTIGTTDSGISYLLTEAFNLSQNYWYGWDELRAMGLPLLPEIPLSATDPQAVLHALKGLPSRRFPVATVLLDGILFRPRAGRGTARFALYRSLLS